MQINKLLEAARRKPISVNENTRLKKALTLMMINNFSQLPVIEGEDIAGFISWETIGFAQSNGCDSEIVKDYINKKIVVLDDDEPLLNAVPLIIKNDFALVRNNEGVTGIVTLADISEQFIISTTPFLLLEQIENHIRNLLEGKFDAEELRRFSNKSRKRVDVKNVGDLMFGDYVSIIKNQETWERLDLWVEQEPFADQLDKVRKIRNSVMHFDSKGIKSDQQADLEKMANFFARLTKFL